jgi:integrase
MEQIVLARTKEGKKAQTIKHGLSLLRAATRYAGELGYRVPSGMNWRVPKVAQKTRYLSPEEFNYVASYLDPNRPVGGRRLPGHLRAARREVSDLLVTLAYTGGRWSEVAHLSWDRVNLGAGTITLWAGKTQRERVVP